MRTLATIFVAFALAVAAPAATTTNVVTNVVYETHVRFDTYPVTNGSYEVYGGTLTTNRVYDTPRWVWKNGGLALIDLDVEFLSRVDKGNSDNQSHNGYDSGGY